MPTAFSAATRRRLLTTPAVGLALLLALGLTGCGGGDANNAAVPRGKHVADHPASGHRRPDPVHTGAGDDDSAAESAAG